MQREKSCLWGKSSATNKISSKFHFILRQTPFLAKKTVSKQFYAYFMNFSSLTLKRKLFGVHQKFLKFFIKITLTVIPSLFRHFKTNVPCIPAQSIHVSFQLNRNQWDTRYTRWRQMPKGENGCEWSSWLTCHLDQICFSQNFCFFRNFSFLKWNTKKFGFLYFKHGGGYCYWKIELKYNQRRWKT